MSLHLVPISFKEATGFVEMWHRHNPPPIGHKFSIGVASGTTLVGVAMIGRPVARHFDDGLTLEVNRTATDGTKNVNSMLYGAAWRATKALGYQRLVTYTQGDETGTSLKAAGWKIVNQLSERRGWDTPSRPRGDVDYKRLPRTLWETRIRPTESKGFSSGSGSVSK